MNHMNWKDCLIWTIYNFPKHGENTVWPQLRSEPLNNML